LHFWFRDAFYHQFIRCPCGNTCRPWGCIPPPSQEAEAEQLRPSENAIFRHCVSSSSHHWHFRNWISRRCHYSDWRQPYLNFGRCFSTSHRQLFHAGVAHGRWPYWHWFTRWTRKRTPWAWAWAWAQAPQSQYHRHNDPWGGSFQVDSYNNLLPRGNRAGKCRKDGEWNIRDANREYLA